MKKVICVLFVCVSSVWAQQPAGGPAFPGTPGAAPATPSPFARATSSITFDVRSVANGAGANVKDQRTGSYTAASARTRESQTTLELRARNLSANVSKAQFDYFFVAQNVIGGKKYIADRGNREIALEGGTDTKETFESKEIVQTTTTTSNRVFVATSGSNTGHYEMRSTQSKSGSRPVGWVVRMFADGKLIRIQASSSELERMAYDPNFGQGPLK